MKRLLSVAFAGLLFAAPVIGALSGCSEPAATPAPSGDVNYKCAMAACTKTKTAKAADPAPS
jgi:hypothetical protein